MNPKPFLLSHHFTLPLAIICSPHCNRARARKSKGHKLLVQCVSEKSLLEPYTPLICDDNKKTLYAGQAFVFKFTPIATLVPGIEGDGTKWLRHSRPWSRRQLSLQLADSR